MEAKEKTLTLQKKEKRRESNINFVMLFLQSYTGV